MSFLLPALGGIILLDCIAIIVLTAMLNTKADTLGAAVTGASDSYRGAMGAEEQKRKLIKLCCIGFIGLSLLYTFIETWF